MQLLWCKGVPDDSPGVLFAKLGKAGFRTAPLAKDDWWAQIDSNNRPHAYQACALTN